MNKRITKNYLIGTFLTTYILWGIIIVANQFGYLKYGTPISMILYIIGGNAPPIIAYILLRKENIITGYGDNTFKPEDNITHAEILTILIRLLGHENTKEAAKGKKWYSYYVNKSKELGISTDTSESVTKDAKRVDVFVYMYNSLPVLLDKDY